MNTAGSIPIVAGGEPLGLDAIGAALDGPITVALHPAASARVEAAHRILLQTVEQEAAVYGANTGFGRLALKRIPAQDLRTLQLNLVRSHAAGVGEPLADGVVRLAMLLKLTSLAAGHSGVSTELLALILNCINEDLLPVVPSQGSVGGVGRPRPARTHGVGVRWPWRSGNSRPQAAGCEGTARGRSYTAGTGSQGRPGSHQRHAGLRRPGAARPAERPPQPAIGRGGGRGFRRMPSRRRMPMPTRASTH